MKLKAEKCTVFKVEYHDFENFVNSIYGGDYDITSSEEGKNDQVHEYDAFKNMIQGDKDYVNKIRNGEYPLFCTSVLFQCLVEDGHIEEGNYLVSVSW